MSHTRRELVAVLGSVLAAGAVAGCSQFGSGIGSGSPTSTGDESGGTATPPPSDADPRELLPEPPDGWEQGELVEQTGDSLDSVGAEAGWGAFYTDSDGGEYYVEILRWPSESDAESGLEETYLVNENWIVALTRRNFSFAANGPDTDDVGEAVVTLVGNAPTLGESYVTNNNEAE